MTKVFMVFVERCYRPASNVLSAKRTMVDNVMIAENRIEFTIAHENLFVTIKHQYTLYYLF